MTVACCPSGVKLGSVALNISSGVLTTHRQEWECATRMMTNPIGPLADLLGIRERAGQRLATERDRAWREPDAALTNHAASAHRARYVSWSLVDRRYQLTGHAPGSPLPGPPYRFEKALPRVRLGREMTMRRQFH